MNMKKFTQVSALLAGAILLTACGSDDDGTSIATYSFTVKNLTHSQPLSPIGIVIHTDAFAAWSIGESASVALEELAEGGANDNFIALDDSGKLESASGTGLLMSGSSETIEVSVAGNRDSLELSLATMLVNTNDAFAGVTGLDLAELDMDESIEVVLPVYDAGTEENDELVSTIPGQGGEGFSSDRTDLNKVARHPGVSGSDLADVEAPTTLTSAHRFDGPVARLTVTRLN